MSETNALAVVAQSSQLDAGKKKTLLEAYQEALDQATSLVAQFNITVTDESQVAEMKRAREGRLALRKVRIEVENRRKALKEQSLRESQAIDGMAKVIRDVIEPAEKHLEEQEKFAQIQREKRLDERLLKRLDELQLYDAHTIMKSADLRVMDELDYGVLVTGAKKRHEERIAAEKKAADEAAAKAEAERVERERIKAENAELEGQLAKERKAREEAEAIVEADRKAKEAAAEAERKAALAPDRDKLLAYVEALNAVPLPVVESAEALALRQKIEDALQNVSEKIKKAVEDL